jgi:hypothetical protein
MLKQFMNEENIKKAHVIDRFETILCKTKLCIESIFEIRVFKL